MSIDLTALLQAFTSTSRLYELTLGAPEAASSKAPNLLVEAFAASESLHSVGSRDIIALSTQASIATDQLLGQRASLQISLSDGGRTPFTGLVVQAAQLGSYGGLARYHLRVAPWIWLLGQSRTSRVWQDMSTIQIVDAVFQSYQAVAAWRWSDEVGPFLRNSPPRSYCVQYRESDLAFVSRLLAEEGLGWRIEECEESDSAPRGHQLVLFADSSQTSACPEDATSAHALGGAGIRFHGASALEEQDAIQALVQRSNLPPARLSLQSFDYKAKASSSVSIPIFPSNLPFSGGPNAPQLESYDSPGIYAFADGTQARAAADRIAQAHHSQRSRWQGRSTVRTLRPGTRFTLVGSPRQISSTGNNASNDSSNPEPELLVLCVTSIGINNLPRPAQEALAELFGPVPQLLGDLLQQLSIQDESASSAYSTCASSYELHSTHTRRPLHAELIPTSALIAQAQKLGYANRFEAIPAQQPWRPVLADGTGLRLNPRPTAWGSQTAIVIGAQGETVPSGADETFTDRLGRIRIRFHWQGQGSDDASDDASTCWVRVLQRSAGGGSGAGMGVQFIPRIGQEVQVQFLEGDIDRPIAVAALYNGQGEGGVLPSPGGAQDADADTRVFDSAIDTRYSGQGNLVGSGSGGHSPVWHGAAANSQRNATAQWGIRSKEYGASGYNQLVFDDTDSQNRIQLKTTQSATELNLGHLLHTADNFRGSLRGTGTELRTDAYGAIRAGAGLLISSYSLQHSASSRDPAGDNSAGMALLKQASTLAASFSQAASTHQTVALASHIGSTKAQASALNDQAAPLQALYTATSGMLDQSTLAQAQSDAAAKTTQASDGKLPHSTDALLSIAAKGGLGVVAGQNIQLNNGETTSLMSGQDSQFASGGQLRVHTGQAIGVLAGAVKAGIANTGLQLIAAKDDIDLQAQAGELKVQAKGQVDVMSANAHIDWAAAKRIRIATAAGASITIEGGNITTTAPGQITVHASQKVFEGPGRVSYPLPQLPNSICVECLKKSLEAAPAFTTVA
ncbi:MAG: type VI secretion system Vgr family protein [Burkholderiales bacterium]|nr:type VI secretion system Vgr family protein [Burkholderiales bacterium]